MVRGARSTMRGQRCAKRGGAALIQIQSQTPAMRGAITLFYLRHKKARIERANEESLGLRSQSRCIREYCPKSAYLGLYRQNH